MLNKKGFTLVEILLVIVVLGMLMITAATSYFNSQTTFSFLSSYKSVTAAFRAVRSYAITNKDSEFIDRYGLRITNKEVILFADDGSTPLEYEEGIDTKIDIHSHNFTDTPYQIELLSSLEYPIIFFYDVGSGLLTTFQATEDTNEIVPKNYYKHIDFRFYDEEEDLERFIVVFQVTGIAEEFEEL